MDKSKDISKKKSQLTFSIYNNFINIKETWESFEKKAYKNPFQSFNWLYLWYETIGKNVYDVKPKIVVIKDDDDILAILPLGIIKKYNTRILTFLGGYQADYMGPLINKTFFVKKYNIKLVWDKILKNIGKIDLVHFLNQNKYIENHLNPLFDILNYALVDKSRQALLTNSWNDYYESMTKSKTRQTDRRKLKKISSVGKVKFIIGEDQKTKKMITSKMINQKRRRFNETNVWDMFSIKDFSQFYFDQINMNDNSIYKTHYSGLFVGDHLIATHFGIIVDDTFYFLMPGQESGIYSKYSPGRLLILELLKWSTENSIKTFDFTGGPEPYKEHWTNKEIPIYELSQNLSLHGYIYYKISNVFLKIKRSSSMQGKVKKIYLTLKYLKSSITGKK